MFHSLEAKNAYSLLKELLGIRWFVLTLIAPQSNMIFCFEIKLCNNWSRSLEKKQDNSCFAYNVNW